MPTVCKRPARRPWRRSGSTWRRTVTARAYGDLLRALTKRGYLLAQILAWDHGAEFERRSVPLLGPEHGAAGSTIDPKFIATLDRRDELKIVDLLIGGVLANPAGTRGTVTTGVFDTTNDLLPVDDGTDLDPRPNGPWGVAVGMRGLFHRRRWRISRCTWTVCAHPRPGVLCQAPGRAGRPDAPTSAPTSRAVTIRRVSRGCRCGGRAPTAVRSRCCTPEVSATACPSRRTRPPCLHVLSSHPAAALHQEGGTLFLPERRRVSGQKPWVFPGRDGRTVFTRRLKAHAVTIPARPFVGIGPTLAHRFARVLAEYRERRGC